MGFLGDLFKPKAQPEEDAKRSTFLMERLKARRGQETGKWLAMMEQSSQPPPPVGPPPTIEDLDHRDTIDEAPYSPPFAAQFVDSSNRGSAQASAPQSAARRAPQPTIEDIDRREIIDEAPYVPPLEAQYLDVSDGSAPPMPSAAQDNQTVAAVERLFAEFQRRATEFNRSAEGTKMMLSVHPPEFTFEAPHFGEAYDPHQKISVFKGHVVAQHWAMLVQGYEETIDVYMLAADQILNFTLNDIRQSRETPFMAIASSMIGGHRVWHLSEIPISLETMPASGERTDRGSNSN